MTRIDPAFVMEILDLGGIVTSARWQSRDMICPYCDSGKRVRYHVILRIAESRLPDGLRSSRFVCSKDCVRSWVIRSTLEVP